MANTSAICNSFKTQILKAEHDFTASTGSTFTLALFDSDATLGAGTTAYSTSEEITGTGYTAGGKNLTSVTPVLDSSTAVCDFGDISWTSSTFTANACLIYRSSGTGDPAVCSVAFGGDKSVSSGTFTIQFPAAAATTAIVRIA
tara:strand:- start:168 stop:599 length:432 start_codon:yes stop_codon:yes gene_type:complete